MRNQTSKRALRASLPPGPRTPSFVQLAATWLRPGSSIARQRRRFGTRFTVQLPFNPPFVILCDPEEIKQLFQAPPDQIHPGEGARLLEPIVGSWSLILLDEDPHLEHRRLLLPAFHGERMQRLTGMMSELTERELAGWPAGAPVRLHPRLQHLTLEIIMRAAFGLEGGPLLDELRTSLTELLSISVSPVSVMLPTFKRWAPWLPAIRRMRRLLDRTDGLIAEQVAARRRQLSEHGDEQAADVLAMLLAARHDDGSEMSDQELRDELVTALVAGHETTASQLAWAFVHLSRAPRVVERLRDELEAGNGDAYLAATVAEVQRLRPVLPNAAPRLTRTRVRIGEVEYPPGIALLASSQLVQHDPAIYPEPLAFRPERFLGVSPGTYTWTAFGGGRRRCIGAAFAQQEMKIVLAEAVRRFDFEPVGRPERTARRSITFSPAAGATVILRERPMSGYQLPDGSTRSGEATRPLPAAASLAGDPAGGS